MAIFLLTSVFDSSLKSDCHMHSQVSCISIRNSNFHITLQLITSHDSINFSSLYLQSLHCSLLGRNQLIFLIPCQSLMILCLWVLACFFISTTFAFVLSWILVCLLNSLCSDGLKLPFITWHLNLTMPSCFVSMWPNNSLNGFHSYNPRHLWQLRHLISSDDLTFRVFLMELWHLRHWLQYW